MQSPILGKANQPSEISFRVAGPADLAALRRLVDLDNAGGAARHLLLDLTRPDSPSRVLVAVSDGSILAATHLGSRHSVAHPFQNTRAALELLEARADQLRDQDGAARPSRIGSLVARLRPARAAVTPRS